MPLDPEISLKASTGTPPGNPLEMASNLFALQSKMNEVKQFNAKFNAQKKAGQILAAAPDIQTGIKNLYGDPDVAGYAPEIAPSAQATYNGMLEASGKIGSQSHDTFHTFLSELAPVVQNQANFDKAANIALTNASPMVRDNVRQSIGHVREALSGIEDPAERAKMITGWLTAGGAGDQIPKLMTTYAPTQRGNELVSAGVAPAQGGALGEAPGQLSVAPGSVPMGLSPTPVTGPYGPGGATETRILKDTSGTGSKNALTPITPAKAVASTSKQLASVPAAGGGTAPGGLTGPSMSETKYMEHRGADIADYEKNLDDRVQNGGILRKNVGEVTSMMKEATIGGGANTYERLGAALQTLGVHNDTVDKWANGSLKASQVIDKVSLQDAMSQLKQQLTGVGGSRMNAQEFVSFLNKNPGLTTDPRTAMTVFNLWNEFYGKDKAEQRAFDRFKAGEPTGDKGLDTEIGSIRSRDPSRWPTLWSHSTFMENFAPEGEISSEGVRSNSGLLKPAAHPADIQAILQKFKSK